ncbi:MAG TPA: GTPase Era [Candidatus Angelobacter sp.]|nr:GTPase Era [Candidatus Angelobacter sp.]
MVSGFVSIIGRPNAGKSTLLNVLVGEKIAIVTDKPQTTRTRIQGIVNVKPQKGRPSGQIIFIDTPGVHRPDSRLNRKMMQEIHEALQSRDLILLIVDVAEKFGRGDQYVLDLVKQYQSGDKGQGAGHRGQGTGDRGHHAPVFLLLNKIDRIEKEKLLPLIEQYRKLHDFQEVIPISATKGEGLDMLLDKIIRSLPEGPRYFPPDQLTDQPERFLASEIVREKVLQKTAQEVPYSIAVMIDRYEELERLTRIAATIYCEREGQKGILIGKKGEMLKHIGTAARMELEHLLGKKVFLELFIKIKPGWRESGAFVDDLDWRRQMGGG